MYQEIRLLKAATTTMSVRISSEMFPKYLVLFTLLVGISDY
jgi:hypothetical protein